MLNLDHTVHVLSRMKIRDLKTGVQVPFHLNPNQRKAIEIVKQTQAAGRRNKYIILKSRRVGMSSLFDGVGTIHCVSQTNANALILAHTHASSQELFRVPLGLVESLPFKLPVPPTKKEIIFPFTGGNSKLSIATAGHNTTGRGYTLSFLHLSEVAFYPKEAAFASLLPAVSDHPSTWIVLESTANGTEYEGEAFYNYWMESVAGENEFTPIFLSWLDDPDSVRDPESIKGTSLDDEEKELMKKFGATRANLAWRRLKLTTECQNRIELFRQEYPHSPDVAFQSSGNPSFDAAEISRCRDTVQKPKYQCRLEFNDSGVASIVKASNGPVWVWREPVEGLHYYIGADAARGEDEGDFAAMVVFCGETGEQCLRLAARINPEVLAQFCNGIGRWYNKAMINVELTGNLGGETFRRLRDDFHYNNLYRWKGKDDRIKTAGIVRNMGGWETTTRTREMAFTYYRVAIREGMITIRDEVLLQQMARSVEEWGSWRVRSGHDDILFAALIGWAARVQYPPPKIIGFTTNLLPPELGGKDTPTLGPKKSSTSTMYLDGIGAVKIGRFAEEHNALLARGHVERVERTVRYGKRRDPMAGV